MSNTVNSKLKTIRESKGISQAKLAELADVTKRSVQNYEQKERDINKAHAILVYKLSKALECDVGDLLELDTKKEASH